MERREIRYFDDIEFSNDAPEGALTVERLASNKIKITVDTTSLPRDYESNFRLVMRSKEPEKLFFPSKLHWEATVVSNETGRKPRLSIRMFRKVKEISERYRKFICDLQYRSTPNVFYINDVDKDTCSIVIRFKNEPHIVAKYSFVLESFN